MPLQATSGAASYDAFGGGAAVEPNYIESVFSTYLYTGNGSTQTITNGIDLAGKGGLIWFKRRSAATDNTLYDTARGVNFSLSSNLTSGNINKTGDFSSFNSDGFTIGTPTVSNDIQSNTATFASWTFRKQPKFFDVVTWTGNATSRTISHSLGSVPACIIVKCTSEANQWVVYHRSLSTPTSSYVKLNSTDAVVTGNTFIWDNTAPTSTVFSVGGSGFTNNTGQTYVAYLFAHDAGGFGLTGTDNVISCGSVVSAGNPTEVTLGWEPQWLLIKNVTSAQDWWILDNMRGLIVENAASSRRLHANDATAETGLNVRPTATGFINGSMTSGDTYIYIAIRRGPMKVPTTGTSVFAPVARTGTGSIVNITTPNFAPDFFISRDRGSSAAKFSFNDKLRGPSKSVYSSDTAAEVTTTGLTSFNNLGYTAPADGLSYNEDGDGMITECFQRAPSFMDVVCYTATGSNGLIVNHNLGVIPELILLKSRTGARGWEINFDFTSTQCKRFQFTTSNGNTLNYGGSGNAQYLQPTSSQLSLTGSTNAPNINTSGENCVAYLFASLTGVSKIGTYAGNGSSQTINCGFTAGARFVLIKQITDAGGWILFDTARGIVSGNDPYLQLQSIAAEVTTVDVVDTDNSGFVVNQTSGPNINTSGETYLFLAIS